MTLRDGIRLLRRWWLVVMVAVLAAGFGSYLVSRQMTPQYRSTTTLLVNQAQSPGSVSYQDILGSQQLTKTYAELATSNLNLQRAAAALSDGGVPATEADLAGRVSARPVGGTQLIKVSVEHPDPEMAALFSNTVAEQFIEYIREAQLAGTPQSGQVLVNTVFVAGRGEPASSPFSPNIPFNVAAGAAVGLGIVLVLIVAFEYLNDRITSREETDRLGAPFLGGVARVHTPRRYRTNPLTPGADLGLLESIRQVQANLAFSMSASDARVILVTSPQAGDGKSTTAANLSAALAESSKRVVLVDGDLRKPDAHRYFGLPNSSGLSTAMVTGPEHLQSFIKNVSDGLDVLTGGPVPPNATQFITSPRMKALVGELRKRYDIVVIDAPPLLGIADATLWTGLTDGAVLIVRHGRTRRPDLVEALRRLESGNAPLIGVILNGARDRRADHYYYRYATRKGGSTSQRIRPRFSPRSHPRGRGSVPADDA